MPVAPFVLVAMVVLAVWYVDWMPKCWCGERSLNRGLCPKHLTEALRKEYEEEFG